jgi:hypothetical protein
LLAAVEATLLFLGFGFGGAALLVLGVDGTALFLLFFDVNFLLVLGFDGAAAFFSSWQ